MTGCGTDAGYQHHRLHGTEICAPCRAAHAAYMANYRVRQVQTATVSAAVLASRRALRRLAQRHPQEYQRLLAEEQAAI